jgi:hypothetical protein
MVFAATQPAGRLVVQEVEDPRGSVEEVERVRGGRRVEHDELRLRALAQLTQPLERDVLLRPGQHGGERLVETVLQDSLALSRRSLPLDEIVPAGLEVQHHRLQRSREADPGAGEHLGLDLGRRVAEPGQPQRIGQPPRRVDGADQRAPPQRRRAHCHRRGERRLSHAAGADAHQHSPLAKDLLE